MTAFPTSGILAVTTGILMGPIGEVYEVMGFLADRSVYTHELSLFGDAAKAALLIFEPALPGEATSENWQQVLADAEGRFGKAIDLPDALRGVITDDRHPVETLAAAVARAKEREARR